MNQKFVLKKDVSTTSPMRFPFSDLSGVNEAEVVHGSEAESRCVDDIAVHVDQTGVVVPPVARIELHDFLLDRSSRIAAGRYVRK